MGRRIIRPQPGPQEMFSASNADIATFGGAAGGGKSWALLFEAMRYHRYPKYSAIIFRRTAPQLRGGGSLWSESFEMYSPLPCRPREHRLEWIFESGAKIQLSHLQHESDKYDHQGRQYAYCVAKGTHILLADHSWAPIEYVRKGAWIETLEGPRKVQEQIQAGVGDTVRLSSCGRSIEASSRHPILTPSGWLLPGQIKTDTPLKDGSSSGYVMLAHKGTRWLKDERQRILQWRYPHPYAKDLRTPKLAVSAQEVRIRSTGEKAELYDLRVQGASHYITWGGFISQNCGFDEATHFTETQFIYLFSRNRTDAGVPPRMRLTANADADNWLREWVDWWIDDKGFPIPERSGVLRWFERSGDIISWVDQDDEKHIDLKDPRRPKSFTFIPASLSDNKILNQLDPYYAGNLASLPYVERMRLLDGNWNIRHSKREVFRAEMFEIVDPPDPGSIAARVRAWDLAAGKITRNKSQAPDFTATVLVSRDKKGHLYIEHADHFRRDPAGVEQAIMDYAERDGKQTKIAFYQDPGAAGKLLLSHYAAKLAGYTIQSKRARLKKTVEAGPVASQAQNKNLMLVRGKWNAAFLSELEAFPDGGYDDQVDALALAFNILHRANANTASIRSLGRM